MLRRFLQYLPSIAAVIAASTTSAQVPRSDTLRLTAADAAARAVATSPALARERLDIERARAERLGAGAFFPELPELEYRYASDAPFAAEGETASEIGVSQEIELGGQSLLRRDVADLGVAGAELRALAAERETRFEARSTFARLAAAEARLRLFDSLTSFARRLDSAASRLLAAEEISELERNAVRIERGRSEIERMTAASQLSLARREAAVLFGVDRGTVIVTAQHQHDVDQLLAAAAEVERRLADGDSALLVERPDWQALERDRERAAVQRRLATRSIVPNVRLGVFLESESRLVTGTAANETGAGVATDRMLGFNVGLRIPLAIPGLYDYGQGAVALADAEASIAGAEQRVLAARIRSDAAAAALRLRAAVSAMAVYARDIAPYITRNLELLERGYRAGELGAVEVITQQQQFAGAGEALIEAELELGEAYADFERALGR